MNFEERKRITDKEAYLLYAGWHPCNCREQPCEYWIPPDERFNDEHLAYLIDEAYNQAQKPYEPRKTTSNS